MCISWCPQVEGLKCYICDSTMDSCYSNVSSKYLRDCHESAQGCTSFSLENRDKLRNGPDRRGERWFQRSCIYWHDSSAFGLDPPSSKLPHEENVTLQFQHVYQIYLANGERRERGIEELPIPNTDKFEGFHSYAPFNRIKYCGEVSDGCNNWEGEPPFPLAEGFPVLDFKERETDVRCWGCISKGYSFERWETEDCADLKNIKDDWTIKRLKKSSKDALGCSVHSIYQASPTGAKAFIERDFWYPGDHWCHQKRFPSTPPSSSGRSLVQMRKSCEEGSVAEDSCSNDSWTGQRAFYSAKEFYEYTHCKLGVRLRSGVWVDVATRPGLNDEIKKAGEEFVEGSGPFAFVGFHLCGPNKDFCNDWIDDNLYKMMDNPPTNTTTTTTTTTPEPTTPITLRGPLINQTAGGGGVLPGEIPDGDCCRHWGSVYLGISTVLFALAEAFF